MARFKLWRPFKEWSPVMKAAAYMFPASLTVLLHQWLMPLPPDTREVLARYYQNELQSWTNIVQFIVFTPFTEEATYRWPSLLLLYILTQEIVKRDPVNRRGWLMTAYALSISMMIAMTAYWASFHDYPITVFLYGLVWGWLMFRTKNAFYSWLFHSLSNAISIIFIVTGHHLLIHR